MDIRANVKKPLDQGSILGNAAHVKDILAIVLLGKIDVMQQLWKGFQHPEYVTCITKMFLIFDLL